MNNEPNWDKLESEYYKGHAPYDEVELFCDDCEAETIGLCVCDEDI
jgi:hypothetical protein